MDPDRRLPVAELQVLKDGDTFIVAAEDGDMDPDLEPSLGLYREDTRILSRWTQRLNGQRLPCLGAGSGRAGVVFSADLCNAAGVDADGRPLPAAVLHLRRTRLLCAGGLLERLQLTHFGDSPVTAELELGFDADFRDIFEVRGARRSRPRSEPQAKPEGDMVRLRYRGQDGRERLTAIRFSRPPDVLTPHCARFRLPLEPGGGVELVARAGPEPDPAAPDPAAFRDALAGAYRRRRAMVRGMARIESGSELFDEWVAHARADLALLTTELETGLYPYAGIPWFSTPFGRDAIITALEVLWLYPSIARGVLAFLAERQALASSPLADADPGKILHETRRGELAATGEVPFGAYFGGVDTTPLFVVLAGAYLERSGELAFIDALWPRIEAALGWIERYGDRDGDGFVEYLRGADTGLANQGWKDSHDSVFHADGRCAEGPVALCEVQGYVYAALAAGARIAEALGQPARAGELRRAAQRRRRLIERRFWLPALGTYALALDGGKAPCAVRASNAGHLLYCGVPSPARARRVADLLVSPAFHSGWGVRTVAEGEVRYNPMSYHNGSVWPHDNALIAAGFGGYGLRDHAIAVFRGLFRAVQHLPQPRLPELFCGFPRRPGQGPTPYPVACLPQAWSSAAVFLLLQACLGLQVDGARGRLRIRQPRLPPGLERLHLRDLQIGDTRLSLRFTGHGPATEATVTRREGPPVDVEVVQ